MSKNTPPAVESFSLLDSKLYMIDVQCVINTTNI